MTDKKKTRVFWTRLIFFLIGLSVLDQAFAYLSVYGERGDYKKFVASKKTFDREADYKIWVMGDSLAADAVVPGVLREETGAQVFNWGVYGSTPLEWKHLGKYLLDTSVTPETVIVVVNPEMFDRPPLAIHYTLGFIPEWRARFGLMRDSIDNQDMSALFASGRKRTLLRSAILRLLRQEESLQREIIETDNGYLASTTSFDEEPVARSHDGSYGPKSWEVQSGHFLDMLGAFESAGVRVVLVVPPMHRVEVEALNGTERYSELRALLEETGLPIFDGMSEPFLSQIDEDDLMNVNHLNNSGAVKLSYALADWLSELED